MKASARTTVCDIVLDSKGGKKNYWCTISKNMSVSVSSGFPNKRKKTKWLLFFSSVWKPWQIMIHSCRYVNIPS